jgi:Protein of unknown function (DUF2938)
MHHELDLIVRAAFIGIGATLIMDLWAQFLLRVFSIPSLNWAMVGRWIGHLAKGRFNHASMAKASSIQGEKIIGWAAHYASGITFAFLLITITGGEWAKNPTLFPAILFGIITVTLPFFIMQPGMGAGIAAAKTPKPNQARLRSMMTHLVFGFGLYLSALTYTLVLA